MKNVEKVKVVYRGKVIDATVYETDDPFNVEYEVKMNDGTTMLLMQAEDENGTWMEVTSGKGIKSILAELIGREYKRILDTNLTDDTFLLSVDHHGKKYGLTVIPVFSELNTYYRVIHGNSVLMYIFPPDHKAYHHWHAGAGYTGEQTLVGVIGEAIEHHFA